MPVDQNSEWDEPYYATYDECKEYGICLTVSTTYLCSRYTVDHNYYAICRNLLSSYASEILKPGGLLHDTPDKINERYGLDEMLRQCARPDKPEDRLKNKDKLLATLEEIRRKVL